MKKLVILLISTMLTTASQAQQGSKVEAPHAVSNAFHLKFPKAENVKWEMEDVKNYEANFQINKTEFSAVFNSLGIWQETETEIKTIELPDAVKESINKQFSGYKIKEADKVEKILSPVGYEVELKKGKEIFEIYLSADGKVLSKKNESSDKNDKD